jgi:hypothetical protein
MSKVSCTYLMLQLWEPEAFFVSPLSITDVCLFQANFSRVSPFSQSPDHNKSSVSMSYGMENFHDLLLCLCKYQWKMILIVVSRVEFCRVFQFCLRSTFYSLDSFSYLNFWSYFRIRTIFITSTLKKCFFFCNRVYLLINFAQGKGVHWLDLHFVSINFYLYLSMCSYFS